MNTAVSPISDRIQSLFPKIQRDARSIAGTLSEYDADDLSQTAALKMLERNAIDPSFAGRPDAEIETFAIWRMRSKAGAGRTYTQYCEPETYITDDEDEEISDLEIVASDDMTPEEIYIECESISELNSDVRDLMTVAKSVLSAQNYQICEMLYQGYSQDEIAVALGVSKSGISHRKETINKALRRAL